MIWKLQYSSQQFLSVSPLSCAPCPNHPHLSDKSSTSCSLSRSPMSGAFSMALNAMPPYFIEHVVGWCWIPPQCQAMGSCIRDVSFGTGAGGRWEEKYERAGGPVHVSLAFGGLYRSRCCFAFQNQSLCSLQRKIYECSPTFPLKDKSSRVLLLSVSDCCALTYVLLSLILFPLSIP